MLVNTIGIIEQLDVRRVIIQCVCTWCNPTPMDGSNPNLVQEVEDNSGTIRMQRMFNTQASEQLNAWLAGFAQILKCMTASNFMWFLHVCLHSILSR